MSATHEIFELLENIEWIKSHMKHETLEAIAFYAQSLLDTIVGIKHEGVMVDIRYLRDANRRLQEAIVKEQDEQKDQNHP